ncbi:MAG: hypothetical protein M1818_004909 [Claussenomyces sp. TS43310]|nr:MAG: hypothetical protein M1818_004909 [Claussenomyces sp. TS43310]
MAARVKRQSQAEYPVTGLGQGSASNGSMPIRKEIRQLQQQNDTWTLYLLGLDWMQYSSQTDQLSWYQITGIHGRPFIPWNGVESTPGNENNGYCTHVSILFPMWHRPYLALYEQVLYNAIQAIASWYPDQADQQRYGAAAAEFRIPYWDWAAVPPTGEDVVPKSVTERSVVVNGPNGVQRIANPLHSYIFQPLNTTDLPDKPLSLWNETLRYPTSDEANATAQNNVMIEYIDANSPSLRSRLYNLFTNYNNYSTFSNEAWIPSDNTEGYDSIESIHDEIHGLTGGNGHMTYIEYSAFDPIFFLHHAMVDRAFAMWQVLNPDSFVTPQASAYGTFTTSVGATEDFATPLTPFYDGTGAFWTSASARYTSTFGYAYDETTAGETGNATLAQQQTVVRAAVNALYGSGAAPSNTSAAAAARMRKRHGGSLRLGRTPWWGAAAPRSTQLATRSSDDTYHEWLSNLRFDKQALDGAFFITLFLGTPSSEPRSWPSDPNFVGSHYTFSRSGADASGSTKLVAATLPLTAALRQRVATGELRSLEPVDAEPYLRERLRYRVSLPGSHVAVPLPYDGDLSALTVVVVSSRVQRAESDAAFPVWGPLEGEFEVDGTR